jgi:carbon monoxide dehydrogenase subunit G
MQFDNSFEVPLPPEEAWKVLLDVPRIAPCLPGAELTETLPDNRFKGRAGVKVGPVNLFFAGEAQIMDINEAAKSARVKAKGNDTKGRGQAAAVVDFSLHPQGSGTRVDVKTDLNMTGAVAQYGRASGLMKEIAGAIMGQFADNLRTEILAGQTAAAPAAEGTGATSAPPPPRAPAPAKPISAFALLWTAIKSLVAGWLGLKRDTTRS